MRCHIDSSSTPSFHVNHKAKRQTTQHPVSTSPTTCTASLADGHLLPKQVILRLVRGVPLPVMVALWDIGVGEPFLWDYGNTWWQKQSTLY